MVKVCLPHRQLRYLPTDSNSRKPLYTPTPTPRNFLLLLLPAFSVSWQRFQTTAVTPHALRFITTAIKLSVVLLHLRNVCVLCSGDEETRRGRCLLASSTSLRVCP